MVLKSRKSKLLLAFNILFFTFLMVLLILNIDKNHAVIAQSKTNPISPTVKSDNMTGTTINCSDSEMENNKKVQNITVRNGEEFVITCESNPTTGYQLVPQFNKDIIILLNQKFQAPSPHMMMGQPGKDVFTFKAIKHGSDTLKIVKKRAWEKAFVEQKIYSVNVE